MIPPILAPTPLAALAAGGAFEPMVYVEKKLPFALEKQQQDYWCWSAMTVSVNHYYDPGTSWTQCTLVNSEFGRADCCVNGGSADCNQPYQTAVALRDLGNLAANQASAAGFQTIMNEINGARPLACRMVWPSGAGHVVSVYGFAQADYDGLYDQWVFVKDPGRGIGDSKYLYNQFKAKYQGVGTWNRTYLTQS